MLHYPEPRADDVGGQFRCEMAALDPSEYELVAFRWPLSRLLIYSEAGRVQREIEKLKQAVREVIS